VACPRACPGDLGAEGRRDVGGGRAFPLDARRCGRGFGA
jgi:hypothetical protein